MSSPVVVHVNLGSYLQPASDMGSAPSDFVAEQKGRGGNCLDPHQAHVEWPSLWATYLRRAFAGPMMSERIAMAFQVSERTARKWLDGQGGCNGRHTRIAMQRDPEIAMQTLYSMAAE